MEDPLFRALHEGVQHSVEEQVCWWTDLRDIQQLSQEGAQILESGRGLEGPCMNHELDL